jgi:hypothetical protein
MFKEFLEAIQEENMKLAVQKAVDDRELNRFLRDPSALDELSEVHLDRLRIVTEDEIRVLTENIRENRKIIAQAEADQGGFFIAIQGDHAEESNAFLIEDLRKRNLLLRLINGEKARKPINVSTQPTREEERLNKYSESQARIDRMKKDKLNDIQRLTTEGENEESIKRRENMWDDAIAKEEDELRKWLS